MKIFYLVQVLSPYRVDWMNELAKDNSVTVYYMYGKEKTRTDEWFKKEKKFSVNKLRCVRFLHTNFCFGIKKVLKKEEYDVYIIDGYSSPVELAAIKKLVKDKKRVYINVDGIDVWRKPKFIDKIKMRIKKKVFSLPVRFLCGSQIAADFIIKNGGDPQNVFKHNFTSIFDKDILSYGERIVKQRELKEKFGLSQKKLVVAAGRFIPLKRYEDLLYAFKDMPDDCVLYLIGGGELKGKYESIINDNGIKNVTLLDFMPSNELYEYYVAADLFVHTTSTDTWGLVINEAMSKGCPIVCSNRCVAGMELIKNGENGFLFDVGDVSDLHKKMLLILDDQTLKEKMTENVLTDIKEYTIEKLAQRHIAVFNGAQ